MVARQWTVLAVVVGEESIQNLKLANTLRELIGRESVYRFLELKHLLDFVSHNNEIPIVVYLDMFCFDLIEVTTVIGRIQAQHPKVVFSIYLDKEAAEEKWNDLPEKWGEWLTYYFRIYREPEGVAFEPIVRRSFNQAANEARSNHESEPVRLFEQITAGQYHPLEHEKGTQRTLFISYSRRDWDGFVSGLVDKLKRRDYDVWIDQHLVVGGNDWMDSIGEALDRCTLLILVMSPDSVSSKYVKMEYRYFFNRDKPIVPIIYRHITRIPVEISTIQYLDFTVGDRFTSYETLYRVLDYHLQRLSE